MKLLEFTIITLWVIGSFGVLASSILIDRMKDPIEPLSPFVQIEKPLPTRPVTGLLSINDTQLLVATDEGIFIREESGKTTLTLPHSLWQDEKPFIKDDVIYISINKYHRRANKGLKQIYKAHKDSLNWKRITPQFKQAPDLFAIDHEKSTFYGAYKHEAYHSSLYKRSLDNFQITPLGDESFKQIEAVAYFKGALYVATNRRLMVSNDDGASFTDITSKLSGGCRGIVSVLSNEHYLILNVAYHLTYIFDGKEWVEITERFEKKGTISYYIIKSLQGDRLVLSQMGVAKNRIFHLKTKEWQDIALPKLYHYQAYELHGDDLYISGALPKDPAIDWMLGKNQPDPSVERNRIFLRTRVSEIPYQHLLWGTDTETVITENKHLPSKGFVIDSNRVYLNQDNYILQAGSGQNLSGKLEDAYGFTRGKVKGHWFITTNGRLHRSEDKGKTWKLVDINLHIPPNCQIDDSLSVAYTHNGQVLSRYNLNTGDVDYNNYDDFKGIIKHIHLDKTGRLYVQTTKGVYISIPKGFWGCPTPFREDKEIPLEDFALLEDRMLVSYNNRLYQSRTDILDWEALPLCDPSDDDTHLPVRIIGGGGKLVILQELQYGHLILFNPETREIQRFSFGNDHGVVASAHILGNRLLIETSGIPFHPVSKTLRFEAHARLISYTIHLKTHTL